MRIKNSITNCPPHESSNVPMQFHLIQANSVYVNWMEDTVFENMISLPLFLLSITTVPNITIEFSIFEYTVTNFNRQFWFFGSDLPQKGISGLKHDHRIQHIQISLSTKLHLKQTSLIFWTKFAQNG